MIGRGDESPLSYFSDMSIDAVKLKIEEWLAPVLSEKNLFLVDIKMSISKKIEVYVDSDTGIQIDECASLSRFLEKNLDGSGLVPDNYTLEVSSPGMSNPLKVPRQYKRRIGRLLEIVKTNGETFEAELTHVDEDKITLKQVVAEKKKKNNKKAAEVAVEEPKEYEVKYSDIKRALIVFKF